MQTAGPDIKRFYDCATAKLSASKELPLQGRSLRRTLSQSLHSLAATPFRTRGVHGEYLSPADSSFLLQVLLLVNFSLCLSLTFVVQCSSATASCILTVIKSVVRRYYNRITMAQAMLKRKAPTYSKEEEEGGSSENIKKYVNVNLLTTMYPLNNSWTKKIIVGLHYNDETRAFIPLIQMLNTQYTHGLHISRASWSGMQNSFGDIEEYFNTKDCRRKVTPDSIRLDDVEIFFTTSFGIKSIVFDKSKTAAYENSSKRRKTCPPTIVMQKQTFFGLKRSITCVDEQYFRLDRIVSLVNKCKDFIKKELFVLLEAWIFHQKDADEIVRDTLKEHAIQIQEKLKKEFDAHSDAVFLGHYFDIVYLELITIYHELFSHELTNEYPSNKE